jgi:hypothetical protein
MRVAGLATVDVDGVENVNVTEFVPGHMAYRTAMPRLLREVGWEVESDEFAEIEDPDPENHEKRQRELINEIEEARKELEKKQEKKGFSFWRKKKGEKKDWEVYDENSQKMTDKDGDPATLAESNVMFDIDAIQREVAALSAEGIEIKEIKSTLPPMKIDMSQTSPDPKSSLRQTQSYNDSLAPSAWKAGSSTPNLASPANGTYSPHRTESPRQNLDEYDEHADGGMSMTFDSSFKDPPASIPPSKSPVPSHESRDISTWSSPVPERPPLTSATTEPSYKSNANYTPGYNAWADEYDDEFGKEKEMKMTFE